MEKHSRADEVWFGIGFVTGFAFLALVVIATSPAVTWREFLGDYGDIIAGIFGLTGGFLAVWKINDQIRQNDRHKEEDRRRSEYAARAVLPNALRRISDYAQQSVEILIAVHQANPKSPLYNHYGPPADLIITAPEVPNDAVGILQENIEFADDPVRGKLAKIIREMQVQNSRFLRGMADLSPAGNGYIAGHCLEVLMRDSIICDNRSSVSLFSLQLKIQTCGVKYRRDHSRCQ